MKNSRIVLFSLLIAVLAVGCERLPEPEVPLTLVSCAEIPVARAAATSVVADGKIYVLGGRTEAARATNDFFCYDPQTDSWQTLPKLPFESRVKAAAVTIGRTIYAGLGSSGYTSTLRKDWWEYDIDAKTWTKLADYQWKSVIGATLFVSSDSTKIHVIYGANYGPTRDMSTYDIASDTWSQLPDDYHRGKSTMGGVGEKVGERCFFGTGFSVHTYDYWYELSPETDIWTKRRSIPGERSLAASTATNCEILVFGGYLFGGTLTTEKFYDDILSYNPETDRWTLLGHLPEGGCYNMIAETVGNRVYFGLGENATGEILGTMYYFEK